MCVIVSDYKTSKQNKKDNTERNTLLCQSHIEGEIYSALDPHTSNCGNFHVINEIKSKEEKQIYIEKCVFIK